MNLVILGTISAGAFSTAAGVLLLVGILWLTRVALLAQKGLRPAVIERAVYFPRTNEFRPGENPRFDFPCSRAPPILTHDTWQIPEQIRSGFCSPPHESGLPTIRTVGKCPWKSSFRSPPA